MNGIVFVKLLSEGQCSSEKFVHTLQWCRRNCSMCAQTVKITRFVSLPVDFSQCESLYFQETLLQPRNSSCYGQIPGGRKATTQSDRLLLQTRLKAFPPVFSMRTSPSRSTGLLNAHLSITFHRSSQCAPLHHVPPVFSMRTSPSRSTGLLNAHLSITFHRSSQCAPLHHVPPVFSMRTSPSRSPTLGRIYYCKHSPLEEISIWWIGRNEKRKDCKLLT